MHGVAPALLTIAAHGARNSLSDLAPALQRLGERHLIGVLEVAADGQPARDAGHAHTERAQELGEVERGRLALDVGVGGEDHLAGAAAVETREQLADLQVFRTDAVERRERAEQHVVAAAVLSRALHRQKIVRLLDDAEHVAVTGGVGTDTAGILVGDVVAGLAGDDALLDADEGLRELAHLRGGTLEQEEGQPLGGLRSDARQPLERVDEACDWLGVVHRSLEPEPRDLEPASELAHLLLDELARLAQRLVAGGEHEVLEHLGIVLVDDLGVDLDRDDLLLAVGLHGHHAAAGRRLDLLLRDLFLHGGHLLLQFLRFLHEVAEALHWPSPSGGRGRTATTSPSNSASAACTAGCDSMPPGPPPASVTVRRSTPRRLRRTADRTISRLLRSASMSRWK